MNYAHVTSRIQRTVLVFAIAITVLAFVNWGAARGTAAAVGAALSVANWFALRWLGARIFAGGPSAKGIASMLLMGKIGLLIAIVFVCVNTLALDPVGLCLGLGVLFLGPALGGLIAGPSAQLSPASSSAASAAHVEARPWASTQNEER